MRILLFTGRGLISKAIRLQTRSKYAHAAIMMDDGSVIESWQWSGVRRTRLTEWEGIDQYNVTGLTTCKMEIVEDFLSDQLGKHYDFQSVLRFVTRRDSMDDDKWFCSELVIAAFRAAGLPLLNMDTPSSHVSPAMLAMSPCLTKVER